MPTIFAVLSSVSLYFSLEYESNFIASYALLLALFAVCIPLERILEELKKK